MVLESIFLVSKINYLGKTWCWESIFLGSELLMKFLEGFHQVAGEAWRWWSHYLTQWVSFKTLAFFEQVTHPSVHRNKKGQILAEIWPHLSSGKFRHRFWQIGNRSGTSREPVGNQLGTSREPVGKIRAPVGTCQKSTKKSKKNLQKPAFWAFSGFLKRCTDVPDWFPTGSRLVPDWFPIC